MNSNHQDTNRSQLLRKNIIGSFFAKAWSALVLLLIIPFTLKCLGEYTNGVWLTISSLLVWIDNMDIGLGNGMRNKLAVYLAHNDIERARSLVSSAFAMLTCIMIPTIAVLFFLILTCNTYGALNVDSLCVNDLNEVLLITVLFVCTTFIFKLIGNFYMGLQLPAVSNMLVALGQTLALIGTYVLYRSGSHSLMAIALVNTSAPFVVYFLAFPITFYCRYPHLRPSWRIVSFREAKEIMSMGIQFFVLQITGVVLFMSSNILISKLFSPAMVTPYQITYRYFSLLLAIFTVICMPYWNATTDAYERGDIQWIRNASNKLDLMVLFIFGSAIVMTVVSPWVYAVWIGRSVHIEMMLSVTMACYVFILIVSMRYSYLLNGVGKLRLQLIFTTAAAVLFIPLAYVVVRRTHSMTWFVMVMCAVNLPGLVVNRMQFNKVINGQAKGIWNQ